MSDLYASSQKPISLYTDSRYGCDASERERRLRQSTTLYVGNLSFYTREEQIVELFSRVGEIKRIIMGLDRIRKTPCGFCFVEYFTRADAEKSVNFLSGTKLDERTIRVDYDMGYTVGRQYGRGRSGGQVRDEYREDYDPGRGGYGKGQTGMTGMDLWGKSGGGPRGDGRGRRGGFGVGGGSGGYRGRGRRGGGGYRGRRFGPPTQGAMGMDNGGYGAGMKRGRYFDEQMAQTGGEFEHGNKRQRLAEFGGNGASGAMDVGGTGETQQQAEEDTRNARFYRGQKDD